MYILKHNKVLAIIPARGGSKRLPGKNIKLLNGKPLIAHSIEFAMNSGVIDKLIVSTDSDDIAAVAKQYGAEVMMRPAELATDTAKTAPVLLHVADELEKQGYVPDIVVLLQPTCPVRIKNLAYEALKILDKNPEYDSIFTGFQKGYTMDMTGILHRDFCVDRVQKLPRNRYRLPVQFEVKRYDFINI